MHRLINLFRGEWQDIYAGHGKNHKNSLLYQPLPCIFRDMRFYPLLFLLLLVGLLSWRFPYAADSSDEKFHIFYYALLIVLITGGSLALRISRGELKLPQVMKYSLIWLVIIMGLLVVYSFKNEFFSNRLVAELIPQRVRITGEGTLAVQAAEDGHFYIEADINNTPVRFMVDTGASDIVLGRSDAMRAGYEVESLNYNKRYSTANGVGAGAPVKIATMTVGNITLNDMPASINQADMEDSLLGMTFLRQMKSYRVDGDTLTLEP